jgi:arylsulfatase A-like enzyme
MPSPNILWIVTTQWRAQAFGFAGDPNARTPCLDRLAAQSVNYAQAVTPHPFGPFARAALLTGMPSPENGVRNYFDPLPLSARTIAHDLKARGYLTAFFGKWHLAQRDPAAPLVGEAHARMIVPPAARGGFEFWEGFESGFLLNDPWLHGSRLESPRQFTGYQSDVLGDRAADWWREQASLPSAAPTTSRPCFCMVSLESPHPPYDAPAAGVNPREPAEIILSANVPRGGPAEARTRRELAGYYAQVEATDRALGRLLAAVSPDTVVIFTSVHGDMHGAHGLFRKGWPYEESVRVPLLMRLPHGEGAGRVCDEAISLVDLPALTRDLAVGAAFKTSRDHALISMPSVVALPHQCDRTWRGVRTKTRKLVLSADGSPWLFFDLERDPLELQNLVTDPARSVEMTELAKLLE